MSAFQAQKRKTLNSLDILKKAFKFYQQTLSSMSLLIFTKDNTKKLLKVQFPRSHS